MTLAEAIAYARAHQPSLLAAEARIKAAETAAQVPRDAWLPVLGATAQAFGGTTNNSTASFVNTFGVDLPRIGGTKVNGTPSGIPSASTVVGIGLHQEVFDFGRIAVSEALADSQVETSRFQTESTRLDLDLAVANAWFSVVAAHEVLTAAQQAVQRATVDRDAALAGVQSGLLRPIDRTRAEADLAHYDVGRVQAEGFLESAQTLLAAVVAVPEGRLDASGAAPAITPLPELNHALQVAQERNPDVFAAVSALKTQQQNTQAIAAALRPDLQLTATVSSRGGGAAPNSGPELTGYGLLPIVPNYDLGLVLSWPLYDAPIARQADTSRQLEQVRREELDDVKLRLNAAVQQAYLQAQVADEAIIALQRSVDAERANDDMARARFKAGLGTSVEVAYAEQLRVQAEIQLAIGRFEQARSRAKLARVLAEQQS
jgi:outer membrane protein TolC